MGTYFGASLFAQGAGAQPAAPAQPAAYKIGVVNVGHVFNNWKKAERFKKELEASAKPFNDSAKKLQDEIAGWEIEARKPNAGKAQIDLLSANIVKNKRSLEDLASDMRKLLGKRSEDN